MARYVMNAYLLIRQSVPPAHAFLAAMDRREVPELVTWLTGSSEPNLCLADDEEFERAKSYEGAIVLSSKFQNGKEIAIVFGPRENWLTEFGQFRDYFAEAERRQAEREHITEEIWLGCDSRPADLANFALPRLSTRKTRLFTIACCELVSDKMVDPRSRSAMQVALSYANGTATDQELNVAFEAEYQAILSITASGRRDRGVDVQGGPEHAAAVLASFAADSYARTPGWQTPDIRHAGTSSRRP